VHLVIFIIFFVLRKGTIGDDGECVNCPLGLIDEMCKWCSVNCPLGLIDEMCKWWSVNCPLGLIDEMCKWCSDSTARPHPQLLRFMAHLVLFFRALRITDKVCYLLLLLKKLAKVSCQIFILLLVQTGVVG